MSHLTKTIHKYSDGDYAVIYHDGFRQVGASLVEAKYAKEELDLSLVGVPVKFKPEHVTTSPGKSSQPKQKDNSTIRTDKDMKRYVKEAAEVLGDLEPHTVKKVIALTIAGQTAYNEKGQKLNLLYLQKMKDQNRIIKVTIK